MSVVDAIKTLKESFNTVQDFKNKQEIADAINTIQNDYMDTLERNTKLMEENKNLRDEAHAQEHWQTVEQQYELYQFSFEGRTGGMCYRPINPTDEMDYYLCTNCFTDRIKSILQQLDAREGTNGTIVYSCPRCQNKVIKPVKKNQAKPMRII